MTTEARKRLHDIRLAAEALCRFTDGKTVVDLQRDEILQAAVENRVSRGEKVDVLCREKPVSRQVELIVQELEVPLNHLLERRLMV